jgi:hypothetical protein
MTEQLCPLWLVAGTEVEVRSTKGTWQRARVYDVEWPWLVYLEGWRGGVHPSNVRRFDDNTDRRTGKGT